MPTGQKLPKRSDTLGNPVGRFLLMIFTMVAVSGITVWASSTTTNVCGQSGFARA